MNFTSTAFAEAGGGSGSNKFGEGIDKDDTNKGSLFGFNFDPDADPNKNYFTPSFYDYFSTYWVGASTWNITISFFMFVYFIVGVVTYSYFFWYLGYAHDKGLQSRHLHVRKGSKKELETKEPGNRFWLSILEKLDNSNYD